MDRIDRITFMKDMNGASSNRFLSCLSYPSLPCFPACSSTFFSSLSSTLRSLLSSTFPQPKLSGRCAQHAVLPAARTCHARCFRLCARVKLGSGGRSLVIVWPGHFPRLRIEPAMRATFQTYPVALRAQRKGTAHLLMPASEDARQPEKCARPDLRPNDALTARRRLLQCCCHCLHNLFLPPYLVLLLIRALLISSFI